jgi:hypothetical protein
MLMDKGMTGIRILALLLTCFCVSAYGQIYKVVDKDGNVTYTDQAPGDGSEPMTLPELSVISTDYEAEEVASDIDPATTGEEEELTRRDLRRMYRDFRISRPAPEETFWGTENTVVVGWECSESLQPGMTVQFTIDGATKPASLENMMALTLERGAHTVSAVLLDALGRPLVNSDTVTFYVHQQTVRGGGP